ncbi:MAG: hypothetical protein FJX47_00805 [Alphaproteobacteria bacterium]|nr:hypothetical protein [Alphaproteobacteria bacterium]
MFRPWPVTASAIVTADFNMAPSDPGYARLLEPFGAAAPALIDGWTRLKPGATHPPSFCLHDQSFGKPHCCDFVLVSEELAPRLRTIQYDLETQASDHQPVVVELADSI